MYINIYITCILMSLFGYWPSWNIGDQSKLSLPCDRTGKHRRRIVYCFLGPSICKVWCLWSQHKSSFFLAHMELSFNLPIQLLPSFQTNQVDPWTPVQQQCAQGATRHWRQWYSPFDSAQSLASEFAHRKRETRLTGESNSNISITQ